MGNWRRPQRGSHIVNSTEPYPYQLHTNRELELMLAGKKPLAMFVHDRVEGFEKSDALAGQDFDTHVRNGILLEKCHRTQDLTPDGRTIEVDHYLYALRGHEWRIEAYLELLERRHRGGWNPHLEWLEGMLLGYTDEQNDYHLSRMYGADHAAR